MKDIKKYRDRFEKAVRTDNVELLKSTLHKVGKKKSLFLYSFEEKKQWSQSQDNFITRKHFISTSDLERALIEATKLGNINTVKTLLIEYKVDGGTHTTVKNKALILALEYNRLEIVELLLEHGANPNENANGIQQSPLSFAIEFYYKQNTNIRGIELLLEHGANPHFGNVWSLPLVQVKDLKITELLVKFKAQLNEINRYEYSILGESLTKNHDIAKIVFLLEHGADIHYTTQRNATIMHCAALSGDVEKIQLIAEYGGKTEELTAEGLTPRELFIHKYPNRSVEEFDKAIALAKHTIQHNKHVQSYTVYYLYKLSNFPSLPLEVAKLIAEFTGIYGQRKDTKEVALLRASLNKVDRDSLIEGLPTAKRQRILYKAMQEESNDASYDSSGAASNIQKKDSDYRTSITIGYNQASELAPTMKNNQIVLPFIPNKVLATNYEIIESVLSFLGIDQNMFSALPSLMKSSILKLIESLATIIKLSSIAVSTNINLNIFDQANPLEEDLIALQKDEESMFNCSRIAEIDATLWDHGFDNQLELVGTS